VWNVYLFTLSLESKCFKYRTDKGVTVLPVLLALTQLTYRPPLAVSYFAYSTVSQFGIGIYTQPVVEWHGRI